VTIDERTYDLPQPFLVLATQNPQEQHGTYPLPESQLDRFLLRLSIGYPDAGEERNILLSASGAGDPVDGVPAVLDSERVLALQARVDEVHADGSLVDYLMTIVSATRDDPRLRTGASTRAAIGLFRAARAYALVDGREYLVPDDVRRLVVPCLAHRMLPIGASAATARAHEETSAILEGIVSATAVPV
jgi:MoxR-like ATPase